MANDHWKKVIKLLTPPVGLDTEPSDLNATGGCLLEDDLEEGGASSPPSKTHTQVALPVASLDHSQHPHSIQKGDTQQQILDTTMSDNEADEALCPSEMKPPLSSPSEVLQKLDLMPNLDINLCRAPPLPTASSSAHKCLPPPRALQPFPIALEEELSDNDDEKGHPGNRGTASNHHAPQTTFAAFHTLPTGSTPPPPPPLLSPQQGKPHEHPLMVTSAAGGSQQQQHISASHPPCQTLPQQQPLPQHPFPPPSVEEVCKGSPSEEGQIPHMQGGAAAAEISIISVSSSGSDSGHDSSDDDNNLVFPLLIARARALVRQRAAAMGWGVNDDVIGLLI